MSAAQPLIKYKDAVYSYADGGVIKGYTKRGGIPEAYPYISWHGNKMPHDMWVQILAFFAWTYDTYKDEALVYLYYNEATGNWLAWAPPQRGVNMTVKTVDDHVNWRQAEEFIGYVKVGTGHHHCAAGAFQSSTDHNDECTGNGLHFTVGKMDKEFHDLHARAVFNGNMVEVNLSRWVEMAPKYAAIPNLPPELVATAYEYSLQSAAPAEIEVPQQWKDNFLRTYHSSHNSSYPYSNSNQGHTGFHGAGVVIGAKSENGVTTMGGTAIVDGIEGYYTIVNGAPQFVAFKHQPGQKKITQDKHSPAGKTPSELGEEKIEALMRGGLKSLELALICEELRFAYRKDWTATAKNDKNALAVIDILNTHGLNAGWLEKLVTKIDMAEIGQDDYLHQQQWGGA